MEEILEGMKSGVSRGSIRGGLATELEARKAISEPDRCERKRG